VALLLALLALLGPRWGEGPTRAAPRGVDVLVCLDVSRSMLARDVSPTRLDAAKAQLAALAERARGDRLGLVVFAGEARLSVPLTHDAASWLHMADLADPLAVARGGTDLGAALDAARTALGSTRGEHEVIVVLTDGEDHAGKGREAAARCRAQGFAVHCVGFGSPRGSKVPVEADGGEAFLRDREGHDVVSAHDPTTLRALAEAAGGHYLDATADPDALATLYRTRILPMARKAFDAEQREEREPRFQWPLLVAVLLWLLELAITDRRRGR
jgi:Ca-activated chloride channel family protein